MVDIEKWTEIAWAEQANGRDLLIPTEVFFELIADLESATAERHRLRAEVEALRKAQAWISVDDRLPSDTYDGKAINVVVVTSYGRVVAETDVWLSDGRFGFWGSKVTHWLPVPDATAMTAKEEV